jgi:hypothetical protein
MAVVAQNMPIFGERGAPKFDNKQPNGLGRFFTQLEALFVRCAVQADDDKKQYAVSFANSDVADTWEALAEYTDPLKTYNDFKKRLCEVYNQVNLRYILPDLDRLVGERQRLFMRTLQDLSEFHLQFNTIAQYLTTAGLISQREQSQAYMRVFEEALHNKVMMRLQIKHPDHHPSLPYNIDDICEAAKWVLQGVPHAIGSVAPTTAAIVPKVEAATIALPAAPAASQYVKTEDLGMLFREFTKTITDVISTSNDRRRLYDPNAPAGSAPSRNMRCNFDGCEKFIRDCAGVEEYVQQGKCRRNQENKVVLPSGAYVPRDVPGQYLKDRLDEYHRRNPNQLASAPAMPNVALFNAVVGKKDKPVIPTLTAPPIPDETNNYQLTAQDRIAALEAELFTLKAKHQAGFVPIIKTRRQRQDEQAQRREEKDREATPMPNASRHNEATPQIVEIQETELPSATVEAVEEEPAVAQMKQPELEQNATEPVHPFRNAKDATYAQPDKSKGQTTLQVPARRNEPAYKNLTPAYDPTIAINVYERALETSLTISYKELLSLSPEVRAQFRDVASTKRIANRAPEKVSLILADATPIDPLSRADLDDVMSDELPLMYDDFDTMPGPETILQYTKTQKQSKKPPKGSIIVEDPVDVYLRNLKEGEEIDQDRLVVAKESSALRSILPLVDNHLKVESILDPGCQIVAMSEEVCHELGAAYDPTIILNMQSANGTTDRSLGLARNLPFYIGDITLYMQVHVIREPAYDILLGRPFDVLTESVVRNYSNEGQTITLHDPNTDKVVTVPTIARGEPSFKKKNRQIDYFRK